MLRGNSYSGIIYIYIFKEDSLKMKKLFSLILLAAMLLTLAACGGSGRTAGSGSGDTESSADTADTVNFGSSGEDAPRSEPITLVMAEVNPLDSVIGQVDSAFKEKVEELSGGTIIVDIRAGGELGAEDAVLDSIMSGSDQIDIACISAFALNPYGVEKTVFCTLPFVFESSEHFWNFANSELAAQFLGEPQELELPVRGLFFGEDGFRHFFTREGMDLIKIEDLAGLKLCVSDDPVMNGLVDGLNGAPAVVPLSDLYYALRTGACDGAEQTVSIYLSNALHEVAPNLILDGHTLGAVQVIITDNAWNKLGEGQQSWLMEAAAYARQFNQDYVDQAEAAVLEELKAAGINIVEVEDKTPWVKAVSEVLDPYTSGDLGEIYDQIMELK